MTPAHLRLELFGYIRGREFLALFGEHQLKGEMKQEIAEFSPNLIDVAVA
jgi:hypothetical protein